MVIGEDMIAQSILIGFTSYLSYKLIMMVYDQNTFKPKNKKNLDEHQVRKSFEDVGGC